VLYQYSPAGEGSRKKEGGRRGERKLREGKGGKILSSSLARGQEKKGRGKSKWGEKKKEGEKKERYLPSRFSPLYSIHPIIEGPTAEERAGKKETSRGREGKVSLQFLFIHLILSFSLLPKSEGNLSRGGEGKSRRSDGRSTDSSPLASSSAVPRHGI